MAVKHGYKFNSCFCPALVPSNFSDLKKICASPSIAHPWVGYYLFLGYLCCSNYPASNCCSFCFLLSILVTQHVSSSGFLISLVLEFSSYNSICVSFAFGQTAIYFIK